MTRRPRRVVPAVVVAVLLFAAAVLVVVSLVQRLTGTREWISYDSLATRLHDTSWGSGWVLGVGIAVAVLGLALLAVAALPGKPVVLALEAGDGMDAGITRRSLRHALADATVGVDGLDKTRVKLRRNKIHVSGHTHHTAEQAAGEVRLAVAERLDHIKPADVPLLRTSVRTIGHGGPR
ncbi:hypothetical protein BOX37_17670 [Nocardia mangyaensis]|uniref:DUF6286 domain-containing protein n=1 Tax=Nocardia mangyaensis TaxID=2213200 RepID=A0A1J0VTY2_9NOCA|nr:DUF6286 domain-containing protein [Nocardia mangyaensis]APE35473.1 hypothetical protein BOX37_17670 [Nocardia mangyaensis]